MTFGYAIKGTSTTFKIHETSTKKKAKSKAKRLSRKHHSPGMAIDLAANKIIRLYNPERLKKGHK